jgi:hypothetical protein
MQASDIRPGNCYRRRLGSRLAATATVLDLLSDLVGIPHVRFAVTVDGSTARLSEVTHGSWLFNLSLIPTASGSRRKPDLIQPA